MHLFGATCFYTVTLTAAPNGTTSDRPFGIPQQTVLVTESRRQAFGACRH